MFGPQLVRAFEKVKDLFDPKRVVQSRQDVRAPKFDDRRYFRYGPEYRGKNLHTHLDWSAYPGSGGGFQGAAEMCNNNGACRTLAGGVMCPSYRVTRDERDSTRGRANTLRLAITGQLGPDALTSDDMAQTLALCVSCKACRRECPTGVDMARMKIEAQAARGGTALASRSSVGYFRYVLCPRWPKIANCATTSRSCGNGPSDTPLERARLPRWRRDARRAVV
jgi:ferredoxin